MSTFNGIIEEFPEITIDYFRKVPCRKPPLAAFLSHVHSDHLHGLESLKAPFVYCSPVTRELLLRLEKYPHRMNFSKGILECRRQHYKHLKMLLRSVPLNTPTQIELAPHRIIKVTLFDANHCAGAVMFLIQDESKAILYTGDIRSEPWWVETLIRNPVILPFAQGLRRLDKIYLDTTFATNGTIYRQFPSKAEGLNELLYKVLQYPPDTVFHFHAWTFGYEEVWVALSNALNSQVHIDTYKYHIYQSLSTEKCKEYSNHEGYALVGYQCGNRRQPGCLTDRTDVRLHSCENGTKCPALLSPRTVFITPIISRSQGGEVVQDLGASGVKGDLIHAYDLQLDDEDAVMRFVEICKAAVPNDLARSAVIEAITKALLSKEKTLSIKDIHPADWGDGVSLHELARRMTNNINEGKARGNAKYLGAFSLCKEGSEEPANVMTTKGLAQEIMFPYSRHSSYEELCHLLSVLRPADVYPCTANEERWSYDMSVRSLFGNFCSGNVFAHDREMELLLHAKRNLHSRKRRRELGEPQTCTVLEEERDTTQDSNNKNYFAKLDPTSRSGESLSRSQAEGPNAASLFAQLLQSPIQCPEERSLQNAAGIGSTSPIPSPDTRMSKIRSNFLAPLIDGCDDLFSSTQKYQTMRSAKKPKMCKNPSKGSEADPIELSDEDDAISESVAGERNFLVQRIPELNGQPDTCSGGSLDGANTQNSLSDAAFDSQTSGLVMREERAKIIQHRQEAYKAAKEFNNGLWKSQPALVSTGRDHGGEELEL